MLRHALYPYLECFPQVLMAWRERKIGRYLSQNRRFPLNGFSPSDLRVGKPKFFTMVTFKNCNAICSHNTYQRKALGEEIAMVKRPYPYGVVYKVFKVVESSSIPLPYFPLFRPLQLLDVIHCDLYVRIASNI